MAKQQGDYEDRIWSLICCKKLSSVQEGILRALLAPKPGSRLDKVLTVRVREFNSPTPFENLLLALCRQHLIVCKTMEDPVDA